ncbi:MAG TPA: hypothetical protein PLU43_03575, partial [Lachnospiraceae bacterium]|nr:hypothetical protein [Lachnospiraceae bacterium]
MNKNRFSAILSFVLVAAMLVISLRDSNPLSDRLVSTKLSVLTGSDYMENMESADTTETAEETADTQLADDDTLILW